MPVKSVSTSLVFLITIFDESLTYANSVLDLELMPDNSAAYLTIASFNYYRWNDFDVFKNFIDSSFQVINRNKIDNLIIDLRFGKHAFVAIFA